jgi:aryl-alcohol dehydrogenase-like predicted oxidoreductase
MEFRRLGNTDIEVSTVCQGCWALVGGGTWGEQDRDQSVRTIRAALDAGINFFDTAPQYGSGESERLVARALADVRDRAIIATKVNQEELAPRQLIASCEKSLRMLETDHIDLLQIHWPNPDVPVADSIAAMLRLQEQGKVRAIGVSNFGPAYMRDALAAGAIVSNQLCYSLLFRAVEYEIQPLCLEHGVGVLCYSPLCQGLLTGKFDEPRDVPDGRGRTRLFSPARPLSRHKERGCERELFEAIATIRGVCDGLGRAMGHVAMAWLLAQGAVTSVIAGARTPEQARDNAAAGGLKLPPDAIAELTAATEWLKEYVGPNADFWQSNSRLDKPARPQKKGDA